MPYQGIGATRTAVDVRRLRARLKLLLATLRRAFIAPFRMPPAGALVSVLHEFETLYKQHRKMDSHA